MSDPFTITSSARAVSLGSNHQKQVVFTVANTTRRTIRGHARLVVQPPSAQDWLELMEEAERVFAGANSQRDSSSQQYTLHIAVPEHAPAGDYTIQLNVVDLADPDENFSEGPAVTLTVTTPVIVKKRFPWWLLDILAALMKKRYVRWAVAAVLGIFILAGLIFGVARIFQPTQATQARQPQPVTIPLWPGNTPMPTARYSLAAVLGSDRQIYAIGGFMPGNQPLAAAEVYDPATNSWRELSPMPTPRGDLAAVRGADGRIYVIGGLAQIALETVEIYDPTTDSWRSAAAMPTARHGMAAVLGPDGRIYVLGGIDQSNNPLQTVEVYDPKANSWSTLAPLPTARYGLAAVLGPDGRIYAIGGRGQNNAVLATVEAYDPKAHSWSTLAPLPTARAYLSAVLGSDRQIYALSGLSATSTILQTVEVYNPQTNSWTSFPPMLTTRYALAALVGPDGRIYTFGGQGPGGIALQTVEVYDPQTHTWTPSA